MTAPAICIEGLTKRFGRCVAVDGLDLRVETGSVFGLVGQNGAGKTTTLRCILDLLRPTAGRITVLGDDSVADSVAIRARVGYLPEETDSWGWMTVAECLWFHSGFYASWDAALAEDLRERLGLDPARKLRALSRGTRAKVNLIAALAHRPELLILDDPTSGLDPVVRREFLEAMIETVNAEGNTVLLSTHLLHEMERVADRVAVLHEGRLLLSAQIDELKERYKKLRVLTDAPDALVREFPDLRWVQVGEASAVAMASRFEGALVQALRDRGARGVEVLDMDLEEIFVASLARPTAPQGAREA